MRVKRSDAIVLSLHGEGYRAFNYVKRSGFECGNAVAEFLLNTSSWTGAEELNARALSHFGDEAASVVDELLRLGALLEESSSLANDEARFLGVWGWGTASAVLHRAVTDRTMRDLTEQTARQVAKAIVEPSPDLTYVPGEDDERLAFLDPDLERGIYHTMSRRRTVRDTAPSTLDYDVLGDLLFAGFGITDWTENAVCNLPLKFAPSGGARNPFDAYLYVREVEGIAAGAYRYSGVDHCIVPVKTASSTTLAALMGSQDWAENASCVIFLVADFGRSMWKYQGDDNAYRVVLIEAGHIAQNIMLMATEHGLSACPSAALDHGLAEVVFGLREFDQSAVYGLAITRPN